MWLILVLDCSVASVIRSVSGIQSSHINLTQTFPFSDSKKDIFCTLLYRKIPYLHISSHQSSKFYYILMHLGIFCTLKGSKKEGSVKSSQMPSTCYSSSLTLKHRVFSVLQRGCYHYMLNKKNQDHLWWIAMDLCLFLLSLVKKSEYSKGL